MVLLINKTKNKNKTTTFQTLLPNKNLEEGREEGRDKLNLPLVKCQPCAVFIAIQVVLDLPNNIIKSV